MNQYQEMYDTDEFFSKLTVRGNEFSNPGTVGEARDPEGHRGEKLLQQLKKDKEVIFSGQLYYHLKQDYAGNGSTTAKGLDDRVFPTYLEPSDKKVSNSGGFVQSKAEVFCVSQQPADLSLVIHKMKPYLYEKLKVNSREDAHFWSYPVFKTCVSEDRWQNGYLWEEHFILVMGELLPGLAESELFALGGLGRGETGEDMRKIDYMKMCDMLEKVFKREFAGEELPKVADPPELIENKEPSIGEGTRLGDDLRNSIVMKHTKFGYSSEDDLP
jgi:hypothetical protein